MKEKGHFAFFDVAYQGFGSAEPDGGATDVWAVRYFAKQSIDMLVCQSFSKNMGLYSERVGSLHVLCQNGMIAENVKDNLRSIIRWEFSSAPAYGARLVETVLENPQLQVKWKYELAAASYPLSKNRERLYRELAIIRQSPGTWEFLEDKGLFSLLGLSEHQVGVLISKYHIYLPWNGRINVAGLNELNIPIVADAVDFVVCQEKRSGRRPS
jgi:aspartate aminotransferase